MRKSNRTSEQIAMIKTLGIDLGKSIFHIHGVDEKGKKVFKQGIKRKGLGAFLANLPKCIIGKEACGSSHHWGREFSKLGHKVQMMAPQFVKPYVKTNKTDSADAEAICEAVVRPSMRFVPIKSLDQQDIQSLHRAREGVMKRRTALINEIIGLAHEYGIVIPRGQTRLGKHLAKHLEVDSKTLPFRGRQLFIRPNRASS